MLLDLKHGDRQSLETFSFYCLSLCQVFIRGKKAICTLTIRNGWWWWWSWFSPLIRGLAVARRLQEVNDEDITPHSWTGYNTWPRDTWEIYWLGTVSQSVNYFQVAEWLAPSAHCPGQRGQDAGAEEQSVSEERSPPDHHCYRDIDDPRLPT